MTAKQEQGREGKISMGLAVGDWELRAAGAVGAVVVVAVDKDVEEKSASGARILAPPSAAACRRRPGRPD